MSTDIAVTLDLEGRTLLDDLYNGVNKDLEKMADAILRDGRKGVTALSEKKDYFTEEQLNLRKDREVTNSNGYPDPSICRGLYRRAYNAQAGSRPVRGGYTEEW